MRGSTLISPSQPHARAPPPPLLEMQYRPGPGCRAKYSRHLQTISKTDFFARGSGEVAAGPVLGKSDGNSVPPANDQPIAPLINTSRVRSAR